jgi:ubiquinone/menaquinone biosynthesis C-methylase UbiE
MANAFERLSYGLSQSARVAWFFGHYLAASRAQGTRQAPARRVPNSKGPDSATFYRALYQLFEQDWRNIEAGLYAPPRELAGDPRRLLSLSGRFLKDARRVALRRARGRVRELPERERHAHYPPYYRRNFHFQTDGYLSEDSAALYDFQVETLFLGAADAMRRACLVPLARALRGRDQRKLTLVDLGCGTGRFLSFVKDNYPRLRIYALDLSPYYLGEARKALSPWSGIELIQGKAEAVPLGDGTADVVTVLYLFHELPPKIRTETAREIARLLKPKGTFILLDSLQMGDRPELDALLERFPESFHEPYYASYAQQDLAALFGAAGLGWREDRQAFLSKVSVFEKAR